METGRPSVVGLLLVLTVLAGLTCSARAAHDRAFLFPERRQAPDSGPFVPRCTTADGSDGLCTELRACPPLDHLLRLYKRNQADPFQRLRLRQETLKCHFTAAHDPRVCCKLSAIAPVTTKPQKPRLPRLQTAAPVVLDPVTPAPVTPVPQVPFVPPVTPVPDVILPPPATPVPDPILPPPETPAPVPTADPAVTPDPVVTPDPAVTPAAPVVPSKLPDESVCGMRTFLSRIFGGQTAEIGAWPWVVSIGYRVSGAREIRWQCGGTLITSHHVVTAAHCVTQLGTSEPLVVRLGELDFNTDPDCLPFNRSHCADRFRDIRIESTRPHELYKGRFGNALEHDIAVIRLARSAEPFTDFVRPVCLPVDLARLRGGADDTIGSRVFITGWGRSANSSESFTPELQEASIRIVAPERCENTYRRSLTAAFGSRLCAGEGTGVDTCRGDSGGPLMTHSPHGTHWYLVGVTSFGTHTCGIREAVYTRVRDYVEWIEKQL
ncbi:phenoloxidase-activating enzyme 1-like isoform X1 [Amphibalanus amphitrite]|uniref:phenoloxidase-activating enzyme 1-like isoform X1 n=2 Tax=Amphibalanus amphitrite TaxID=1232801 RepID=UPI001C916149|nr:phenoloxidase-activating enzyme 1-like isoform X1 [Amphibalanus amphitrite]